MPSTNGFLAALDAIERLLESHAPLARLIPRHRWLRAPVYPPRDILDSRLEGEGPLLSLSIAGSRRIQPYATSGTGEIDVQFALVVWTGHAQQATAWEAAWQIQAALGRWVEKQDLLTYRDQKFITYLGVDEIANASANPVALKSGMPVSGYPASLIISVGVRMFIPKDWLTKDS